MGILYKISDFVIKPPHGLAMDIDVEMNESRVSLQEIIVPVKNELTVFLPNIAGVRSSKG